MEDEKVPVTFFLPKGVRDELDKLVKQSDGLYSSRSHVFIRIYKEWKQAKKSSKKASVQMYEAIQ